MLEVTQFERGCGIVYMQFNALLFPSSLLCCLAILITVFLPSLSIL